ncbi:PrpF protein [Colletotrichum godetiae]|uniref:PrpF protein n=1 Tax=Colletotrichum godetiae TaxID=1209918 RepID=A0AAJ0A6U8_9PEZI|nr:PrpF protein [Colletotrichum godetiae]KAK1657560.1 PrpF protein [Colletotrichum godetiae]
MGGGRIVTSGVAIVQPSQRPDADADYTFAQVSLDEAKVSYDAICGNIRMGVGPFAINKGLLETDNWRVIRIYNTGTNAVLVVHVPIDYSTGRALEKGDYSISGCPDTGAFILMDSSQRILPTSNPLDSLKCKFGAVDITYREAGNAIAFVAAHDLGIQGNEAVSAIDSNSQLNTRIREVRGRTYEKLGRCNDWKQVGDQSPMLPMVALVSKATSEEGDVQARLFLDNHCHPSMAGTGGVCTTAVSRIEGPVLNCLLKPSALARSTLQTQHPVGHLPMSIETRAGGQGGKLPTFRVLGFIRTHCKVYFPGAAICSQRYLGNTIFLALVYEKSMIR